MPNFETKVDDFHTEQDVAKKACQSVKEKNMIVETVTCSKCQHSCFSPCLVLDRNIPDSSKSDIHYMLLTCLHCCTQMVFIVDLLP